MTEPAPRLDYAEPTMFRPAWAGRAALALTLVPVVALLLLHVLYMTEWANNGGQPNAMHHGPSGSLEEAVYVLTDLALGVYLVGGLPGFVAHVLVVVNAARGRPSTPGAAAAVWLWWAGVAAWPLSVALLMLDPFGAMEFKLD